MFEKLKFQTFDNTGINLLMKYFDKAPEGKATWDEAFQFLSLLYSIAFADAVYVADFEKVEDYSKVKRWFDNFQEDWMQGDRNDPFFRPLEVHGQIENLARIAADDMLLEVRQYIADVSAVRTNAPDATFPESSLNDDDYEETVLGPDGAMERDKEVHRIITDEQKPEAAAAYINSRQGIVPLMFLVQPQLLKEIRRLRDFGWSKDRSYCIAIQSRMIANSAYCSHLGDAVAAHVPASSRVRHVADTNERFEHIIGRLIWNEIDENMKQTLRSDIVAMSHEIAVEKQAALGWMEQYIMPIQIAVNVREAFKNAGMQKRIWTMISKAKEFAINHNDLVSDGRKYDYLLLKPQQNENEKKEFHRIRKAYSPTNNISRPLNLSVKFDFVSPITYSTGIPDFGVDLFEVLTPILERIRPLLAPRYWRKRKLLRELVIRREPGNNNHILRDALGIDPMEPPLESFYAAR